MPAAGKGTTPIGIAWGRRRLALSPFIKSPYVTDRDTAEAVMWRWWLFGVSLTVTGNIGLALSAPGAVVRGRVVAGPAGALTLQDNSSAFGAAAGSDSSTVTRPRFFSYTRGWN